MARLPIARALLEAQLSLSLRDHFTDERTRATCEGCAYAGALADEIAYLRTVEARDARQDHATTEAELIAGYGGAL